MFNNIWKTGTDPKKQQEEAIAQLLRLGFTREQSQYALQACSNDVQKAADMLFQSASDKSPPPKAPTQPRANTVPIPVTTAVYPNPDPRVQPQVVYYEREQPIPVRNNYMPPSHQQVSPSIGSGGQNLATSEMYYGGETEEQMLNRVMEESAKAFSRQQAELAAQLISLDKTQMITHLNEELIKFEPLNPDQRARLGLEPVGLKNIGNTCYFNSLIQAYFYIPEFAIKILTNPKMFETKEQTVGTLDIYASNIPRAQQCMTLAGKLAKLFSKMVLINRKYTEPSEVLRALVDDFGNQITLGDQKDIGEFNLNFLERIEEGLGERQQAKKAVDQEDMDFMERMQELEEGGEERIHLKDCNIYQKQFEVNAHVQHQNC